jgi:hypothetical protein
MYLIASFFGSTKRRIIKMSSGRKTLKNDNPINSVLRLTKKEAIHEEARPRYFLFCDSAILARGRQRLYIRPSIGDFVSNYQRNLFTNVIKTSFLKKIANFLRPKLVKSGKSPH